MRPIHFKKERNLPVNTDIIFKSLAQQIPLLKNGEWEVNIQKPKRNNDQNSLFWMWCSCVSEQTGMPIRQVYQYFCEKFNTERCTYFKNGGFDRGGTSDLNTKQYSDMLNNIQVDALELGIRLPLPEDFGFDDFCNEYKNYIHVH